MINRYELQYIDLIRWDDTFWEAPVYQIDTEAELFPYLEASIKGADTEKKNYPDLLPGCNKGFRVLKNGCPYTNQQDGSIPEYYGDTRRVIARLLSDVKQGNCQIFSLTVNGKKYTDIRNIREITVPGAGNRLIFKAVYEGRQVLLGLPVMLEDSYPDIPEKRNSVISLSTMELYTLLDPAKEHALSLFGAKPLMWFRGRRVDLFYGSFRNEKGEKMKGIFYFLHNSLIPKYAIKEDRNGELHYLLSDVEWSFNRNYPVCMEVTAGAPKPVLYKYKYVFLNMESSEDDIYCPPETFARECKAFMEKSSFRRGGRETFIREFEKHVLQAIRLPKSGMIIRDKQKIPFSCTAEGVLSAEITSGDRRILLKLILRESLREDRPADYFLEITSPMVEITGRRGHQMLIRFDRASDNWSVEDPGSGRKYSPDELFAKGMHIPSAKMNKVYVLQWNGTFDFISEHRNEVICCADEAEQIIYGEREGFLCH
ncbi:MAG: hypothetical protein K6G83_08345 [Lachnospiraceae bacterium]|nr:hypothetical protein [Lachnospiraceae bacterium]